MFMRPFLVTIVALLVILSVGMFVGIRLLFAESRAIAVIEQHGAGVSKPIPTVTVSASSPLGEESFFGDPQLTAIIPVLEDLDKFTGLKLDGTSITDASMSRLKSVPQLETLDVSRTRVTVKGLLELRSLPKLKVIRTGAMQLTSDDRKALAAAMPNVDVQ